MLSAAQIKSMKVHGYCKLEGLYSPELLKQLKDESETLIERYYNPAELEKHSVYPSDSSDSRVSHAIMISEGESELPRVDHNDLPAMKAFLKEHNQMLKAFTGKTVPASARCMLNYQNYYEGSKPVAEHFDGEYLRAMKEEEGIEFNLIEGILPRYVAVLVLANENDGKGVELIDGEKGEVIQPGLRPGDLVIFDNIRMRHRVPTLEKPRTTIGLRNFDHIPLHFARTESDFLDGDYRRIPEGWVSEDVDCIARFNRYMKEEWPIIKKEYSHYF